MKIYKGQYGWSTSACSKDNVGNEIKLYPTVQFPQNDEPFLENIEGKLWFEQEGGPRRECFISSYRKKDGTIVPKIVMSSEGGFKKKKTTIEQTTLTGDGRDLTGHFDSNKIEIDTDELPFY